MNELKTNVNDIKSVAKILKKELALMDFKLSHSGALNLASRSLGFKNYQVYKGLLDDSYQEESMSDTLNGMEKDMDKRAKKRIEEYPSIHHFFVKLSTTSKYDIFIYKEFLDYENLYSILFEIKDSYTGRTFFHAKDNVFYTFDKDKEHFLPYEYQIPNNNIYYYFNMINQLKDKAWTTNDMIDDLMELIESVIQDKNKLEKIGNKYSNEELEKLYKEQKND